MKTPRRKTDSGSVLVTTLIMSAVLGLVLASYLTLLSSRNQITLRWQAWSSAIPVLEAGIEEAFTHLQDDSGSLTNNGWTYTNIGGQFVYTKQRSFADGSSFFATIYNGGSNNPVIYSQGYVPSPLYDGQYISRTVRVTATNSTLFGNAIASKGAITLAGQSTVDSYNSSNPLYSTNGMYTPSRREANGDIVTDSRANPAISVGTAHVYGVTDTGPGGTVVPSGQGSVGDLAWGAGVEPGWAGQDMNVSYFDQAAPAGAGGWSAPVSGNYSVGGTNYSYVLAGGGYKTAAAGFIMSGGQSLIVTGNSTLYVPGNVSITGQGFIYIAPGASLKLVVAGSTTALAGGGVVNGSGLAANFSYVGLPGNTSVSYTGGSSFIGTVNAPEAAFLISGGSDLFGAVIANTFSSAGGSGVHFDESLATPGPLVMTLYTEL